MGLTELIFGITPVEVQQPGLGVFGSVVLDACVKEVHSASAQVSRHPIESGFGQSDVGDHVAVAPVTVQLEGVISNYPAEFGASLFYLGLDRAQDAYYELIFKVLEGRFCTIVTTLETYEDMIIESFVVNRDVGKANALFFSLTAVKVALVALKGEITGIKLESQATKQAGVKAKAAADSAKAPAVETAKQSFLSAITGVGI